MPQLDFFSISNQFFWGILYLVLFYIFMELYLVPTLFASLFAREYFMKIGMSDNFDSVYYSFIAFSFFSLLVSEITILTQNILFELEGISSDLYFVFDKSISLELRDFEYEQYVFEELDSETFQV